MNTDFDSANDIVEKLVSLSEAFTYAIREFAVSCYRAFQSIKKFIFKRKQKLKLFFNSLNSPFEVRIYSNETEKLLSIFYDQSLESIFNQVRYLQNASIAIYTDEQIIFFDSDETFDRIDDAEAFIEFYNKTAEYKYMEKQL